MLSLRQLLIKTLVEATQPHSTQYLSELLGAPEPVLRTLLGQMLKEGVVRAEVKYTHNGKRMDMRNFYFVGATK